MAMSFRSLGDLKALEGVEDKPRRDVVEHAQHQPEERAPVAASVALQRLLQRLSARSSSDAGISSRSARAGLGPEASLPLVSCICPTYNRPPRYQHLLEEAIASFLRQDYPNKELIVINDCPGQELICDEPGVRVVNVAERFPSIGDKLNAAVGLARGELIARWDDDDISLPWRLSLSVERLGDADYFNPRCYWFLTTRASTSIIQWATRTMPASSGVRRWRESAAIPHRVWGRTLRSTRLSRGWRTGLTRSEETRS
jgi:hypothetical protein